MTTYTDIPDGDVDQDSPVTQPLLTALRDNPIAIAEGAAGAPKIADKVVVGVGTTTLSGLDDFGGLFLIGGARETNASASATSTIEFTIEFSTDDGATFSSPQTIESVSQSGDTSIGSGSQISLYIDLYVDFDTGAYTGVSSGAGGILINSIGLRRSFCDAVSGTVTGMSGSVTDIRFSGLDTIRINPQGGDTST